jgi:rubrerythrin
MKAYRCLICGDPYMGEEMPTNCPFCGAEQKYLVDAEKWLDENNELTGISEESEKNLRTSLQLEANNAPFYNNAMLKTGDVELQAIFRYLSSVEREHASVIKKILKCEIPAAEPGKDRAKESDRENLITAHAREESAAFLYRKFAALAAEPRIRKVFTALSEIESDHILIEEALLKRF